MLSNSSKYAIKAVLFLALYSSEDTKIMIKDIAKPINVPQAYIAKLLQELSKRNLISSSRGVKGGFYLNEENRRQPVMSIVNLIDGEKKINACLLSLDKCHEDKPCPLHKIANPSREILIKILKNKTINDLSLEVKSGNAFLPL